MYLGLDLGTSGVKALLIDSAQRASAPRTATSMCRVRILVGPSRIRPIGCRLPTRRCRAEGGPSQ